MDSIEGGSIDILYVTLWFGYGCWVWWWMSKFRSTIYLCILFLFVE